MTMKNGDMPAMPVDRCDADALEAGIQVFSGMTKREMMAMHIAAGLISDPQVKTQQVAKDAVRVADLLIAELERTK